MNFAYEDEHAVYNPSPALIYFYLALPRLCMLTSS